MKLSVYGPYPENQGSVFFGEVDEIVVKSKLPVCLFSHIEDRERATIYLQRDERCRVAQMGSSLRPRRIVFIEGET